MTRDRASAYSSAIQEILPDAMQVADRFHLHQNLLEAVKDAVNSVLPVDIRVPIDGRDEDTEPAEGKKITHDVDNSPEYDEKKVKLYHEIQEYVSAGYSQRQIMAALHCSSATVIKYRHGASCEINVVDFP